MKSRLATVAGIGVVLFLTVAAAYQQNYGLSSPYDSPVRSGGAPPPSGPVVLTGTLVDAGCQNRSAENLASAPMQLNVTQPAEPAEEEAFEKTQRTQLPFAGQNVLPESATTTASGITVDKATLDAERADVVSHQVPDLYSRQPDDSCAITGDTKAFALLLSNGRLLNLDEGGNTWAFQAVQSTDAGRAVLSGTGSPFKPRATVKGEIWADQLLVESLSL
jgi:hypothetical protein